MNVTIVTAPREASEPAQDEPARPAAGQEDTEGQSAFAVLLALLQGLSAGAAAPSEAETSLLAGQGDGTEGTVSTATTATLTGAATADALLNGADKESTAALVSADATSDIPAAGMEQDGIAAAQTGKSALAGTAEPVLDAGIPEQTTQELTPDLPSTHDVNAPEADLLKDEARGPVPESASAAEGAQSVPVAKKAQDVSASPEPAVEEAEVSARPVVIAKATLGDDPEGQTETGDRSTARYMVAKAGQVSGAKADATAVNAQGNVPAQDATSQVSGESEGETDVTLDGVSARTTALPQTEGRVHMAGTSDAIHGRAADTPSINPGGVEPSVEGRTVESARGASSESTEPAQSTLKTLGQDTVKSVRYLLGRGEQTLRIRLIPESLGELRLEITSAKDEISVRLSSGNQTVRELLHTQVHSLREALSQDGTSVSRISIVADTGTGMASQGGNADRAFSQQTRTWNEGGAAASANTPQSRHQSFDAPRTHAPHAGALNLLA